MRSAALALSFMSLAGGAAGEAMPPWAVKLPPGPAVQRTGFDQLQGWDVQDFSQSYRVFRTACAGAGAAASRPGAPPPPKLAGVCAAADAAGGLTGTEARRFFETRFEAFEIKPDGGPGFMTGYYEPEVFGTLERSVEFSAPLYARPAGLIAVPGGAGVDAETRVVRKSPDGGQEPYPERAAIENGALGDEAKPLAFVRDEVEAFFIHVQGSARIRFADGSVRRLTYAARNGRPYTSIGRIIASEGLMKIEDMNLASIKAFLRADPERGRAILRRNQSFIFFTEAAHLGRDQGPTGGAGLPLTPYLSIAIDNTLWTYGLPVWIEAELPEPGGGAKPFRALTITQDTGTAIRGAARVDLFHGSGEAAGERAGLLRHPVRFVALMPRESLP